MGNLDTAKKLILPYQEVELTKQLEAMRHQF
jgi:hypothetical protein